MLVLNQISHLFFPPKLSAPSDITFKEALDATHTHKLARITKAALFALSSVAATVSLVLTEAAVIGWPFAIPAILLTVITGVAFFRLNSLEKRYAEGLDDVTRTSLVKKELDRILLTTPPLPKEETVQSFKAINRVLGNTILDLPEVIHTLYSQDLTQSQQSLADLAHEHNQPLAFAYNVEWFERGHYGLPSYQFHVEIIWSGNLEDSIHVKYYKTEKTRDGKDLVKEPPATVEKTMNVIPDSTVLS
jgi:hypothetical protein